MDGFEEPDYAERARQRMREQKRRHVEGNGHATAPRTDENVDFYGRPRPPEPEDPGPPQMIGDEPAPSPSPGATDDVAPWPDPPAAEVYLGLAGEIVRAMEPQSEADPVALLIQILVAFGNVIGRSAHFLVEGCQHFCILFAILVGETSKARKGTSWSRIRCLLEQVDSEWASKRILGGLSSGEGLIWNVRDPIQAREKIKEKGRITGFQEYEADPGVSDKRLLVHEPEFAIVLRQIERQGNTLSAIIRQAWERGDLRTLTKNSPATATGAHISKVGHITAEELRRYLSTTEAASGFGNRFLWLLVRRSKCLPEGGSFVDVAPFAQRLSEAIAFAWSAGELRLDDNARKIWREVYPSLSEGKAGLAGALVARAEAQTMRLACVYALLDQSPLIQAKHLMAALALWDYCERSVRFIFGDSLGDDVADEILSALRSRKGKGMTRTEIANYFGRHHTAGRIARALGILQRFGLAECRIVGGTGGRPAENWFACEGTAQKAK